MPRAEQKRRADGMIRASGFAFFWLRICYFDNNMKICVNAFLKSYTNKRAFSLHMSPQLTRGGTHAYCGGSGKSMVGLVTNKPSYLPLYV